jgi:ABC-type nitrate/sulfonate/bicarbonate transport system substrate-binding protein
MQNVTVQNVTVQNITVNVFPGGFNWGIYVAQHLGLFERNGIGVEVQETPNSVAQMTALSAGTCDIAMTAVDNIVAYVEGQGEAPIGPQPEFFAFMGSDTGFLSLVARPDIHSIGEFKGRTLSVDAMTTGYAFVLFEILRRNGLDPGDYHVVKVGGMVQRFEALCGGRQDATVLSTPYNILAKAQGLHQLARGIDGLGRYQGNVGATRRSWARTNTDAVIGYIRAYVAAIDWLYDRSHRGEAITILRKELPHMTAELAGQTYDELLDPKDGFFRNGEIDIEGLKIVLDLRNRYAKPAGQLGGPEKYFDNAYHRAALDPSS